MRNDVALLVIDVQKSLFAKSTPIYNAEGLLENVNHLIDCARQANVPVVYLQHCNDSFLAEGSDGWQLHPQLHPPVNDLMIHKRHGSAFKQTPLKAQLDARGVSSLVVTGLVTQGCVRATCLDAKKLGYRVVLASDGHSNYHKQAAKLIQELNQKLSEAGVELRASSEINFHE